MNQDKPTLYLETSVPSYLTARPSRDVITLSHQQITRAWWDTQQDRYTIYVSEMVIREISAGDADAATRRMEIVGRFPILRANEEVERLTETYLHRLSLPSSAVADAAHLAFASAYKLDYVLTWNCRHLARGTVKKALLNLNKELGLTVPTVCTPEEMLYENE